MGLTLADTSLDDVVAGMPVPRQAVRPTSGVLVHGRSSSTMYGTSGL
jgi:hypothetical protein